MPSRSSVWCRRTSWEASPLPPPPSPAARFISGRQKDSWRSGRPGKDGGSTLRVRAAAQVGRDVPVNGRVRGEPEGFASWWRRRPGLKPGFRTDAGLEPAKILEIIPPADLLRDLLENLGRLPT